MCKCSSKKKTTFNAEKAFENLNTKHNALVKIVQELASMNGSSTKGRKMDFSLLEKLNWIIGGEEVSEGEFPECCLVGGRQSNTLTWFCTGVLIHKRVVLTAGHCFDASLEYQVALNVSSLNTLARGEIIHVKELLLHHDYFEGNQQFDWRNDLAALILEKDSVIAPASMASTDEVNLSNRIQLVGFGNNEATGTSGFGIKRKVVVPITGMKVGNNSDLSHIEKLYRFNSNFEFSAGGDGYDACTGDSGGPAYVLSGDQMKLAGLTSRMTAGSTSKCGEGGVYTRVDAYADFINSSISQII